MNFVMLKMTIPVKLTLSLFVLYTINCQAFDDGKYSPEKYRVYDDGKYYRPLSEGKYIPGDEGKYTYVYRNTLYPAFPYKHQKGPSGGFGGNGGYGGNGGSEGFGPDGSYGPDGPYGPDGSYGPNGPNELDESTRIQYIGRRIYAERYPYIHKVIKGLVGKYVSMDNLYGDTPDGSTNHYNKVYADKETAAKCRYLTPRDDKGEKKDKDNQNNEEFVTQYPPRLELAEGEKLGTYYSFKGTKVLNTVKNALKSKIKLEYEVFVRIVDEVTES